MTIPHILLTIFICMIWGVNFVVAKIAVTEVPPLFFLCLRLLIVAIILLPFIKKPKIPFLELLKISTVFSVLHFGAMFLSLSMGIDASIAVLIDQLRVPFVLIFSYFMFGDNIGRKGAFGIALALLGTFVILGAPSVGGDFFAIWIMAFSAAAWAIYNLQIKNLKDIDMLQFIGWVSLLGVPQLFAISLIFETNQFQALASSPYLTASSLLYVSVFASIIGHGSWFYLLQHNPVHKIAAYSLLVPLFGVLAGIIFLQEPLTYYVIIGACFTIAGVAVIVKTRKTTMLRKINN